MAVQQKPGSNSWTGTPSAARPIGRQMLWSVASMGLGLLLILNSPDTSDQGTAQVSPGAVVSTTEQSTSTSSVPASETAPGLPRSVPKRLSIPDIAVDAPFTGLSIGASGQLNAPAPDDNNLVGWFKGGVTPGERGASIVAGHVDTRTGPAVFLLLNTLKKGSKVDVTREDGTVATFKVDSVETFSKANFPDNRVYTDTPDAQLRLITCGGSYDRKAKDYSDNVVVFAHLDSSKGA
ncbi:class F sortase [Streptomyces sp. NBC_00829]|uniref:class F sortase n=1 Tax=Streptomyces sp. NBC_00829 TaxID=2903679 RepID=UPI00386CA432|nr:class F sortase [Streptomyces sp. NBC_00829]